MVEASARAGEEPTLSAQLTDLKEKITRGIPNAMRRKNMLRLVEASDITALLPQLTNLKAAIDKEIPNPLRRADVSRLIDAIQASVSTVLPTKEVETKAPVPFRKSVGDALNDLDGDGDDSLADLVM